MYELKLCEVPKQIGMKAQIGAKAFADIPMFYIFESASACSKAVYQKVNNQQGLCLTGSHVGELILFNPTLEMINVRGPLQFVDGEFKCPPVERTPETFGELKVDDFVFYKGELWRCLNGEEDDFGDIEMLNISNGYQEDIPKVVEFDKFLGQIKIDLGIIERT